jgi:hypothetical protein
MTTTLTRPPRQDVVLTDKQSARRIDEQGFLHVDGCNISKACVNPYRGSEIPNYQALGLDPVKVYRLFRDPEELEKAADTFNNLPLMDNHIEVSAFDLEDPEIKKHWVGSIGNDVRFKAPYLVGGLVVNTAGAIMGEQSKEQTELSCAYRYELDMTPGVFDGQAYDGRMTNIRGNHVALVDEGRAGHDVTVKDSASKLITEVRLDITDLRKIVDESLRPIRRMLGLEKTGGVTADENPEGINQYTGNQLSEKAGSASEKAEKASQGAGTKASLQKAANLQRQAAQAHKDAALTHKAEGNMQRAEYHAGKVREHGAALQQHNQELSTMHDSVTADATPDLALDIIKHVKGHKDSAGKSAPWVIVSEKTGKVIWSGGSKEAAVKQLRNVEGHKADDKKMPVRSKGVTVEDDNPEGVNQYTGGSGNAKGGAAYTKASNEASRLSRQANRSGKSSHHIAAAQAHENAARVSLNRESKARHESQARNYRTFAAGAHDSITIDT